jgi:hypothetical protein
VKLQFKLVELPGQLLSDFLLKAAKPVYLAGAAFGKIPKKESQAFGLRFSGFF